MADKKICGFCDGTVTTILSNPYALVEMLPNNTLHLGTDCYCARGVNWWGHCDIPINYCPFCGRKLRDNAD